MRPFADFHRTDTFEESLNATFIGLIPKVAGVDDIKKFRSISLVENVYKILAKVLALRMRKFIGKIVGFYWHALIQNCQNFRCIFYC